MRPTLSAVLTLVFGTAILVSCSSGAGGQKVLLTPVGPATSAATSSASPVPTPSPTPSPSAVPSAGASIPVGAAPASQAFPAFGGYSGTINLSATTGSTTTATLASTTFLPPGLPAIMSAERHPFATSSGNAALFYVSFTPAAQVIFALPGFTFTLPSIGSNPTLGLAFLDPTAASVLWQYALYGSPAISGTSVTFNSVGGQIQFQAGKTYWFALYAGLAVASPSPAPSATPAPTASPSPSPSPTPSPSPSATASATPTASPNPITVNPTSVTVAHGGGTATVIITEASANFISVASQDTTKATVSPSSGASPLTITITGVAVGTTKIVITDNNLVQQTVSVTVT